MGARDDRPRLRRRARARHPLLPPRPTTGALSDDTVRMLLVLAKQAKRQASKQGPKQARHPDLQTTHDSFLTTCYGTARTSPRSYFPHHTAAISAAIAFADATSVMHAAAAMSFRLSLGLAP